MKTEHVPVPIPLRGDVGGECSGVKFLRSYLKSGSAMTGFHLNAPLSSTGGSTVTGRRSVGHIYGFSGGGCHRLPVRCTYKIISLLCEICYVLISSLYRKKLSNSETAELQSFIG